MSAPIEGIGVSVGNLRLQSRLGYTSSVLEQDGVLWVATQQNTKKGDSETDEVFFVTEYKPAEQQEWAFSLFQKARVTRVFNPYDPSQWRIEKWLTYDMSVAVCMPNGAELIHEFRHGERLYSYQERFFITFTDMNKVMTFHDLAMTESSVKQWKGISLAQAVQCAVKADLDYRKAQRSEEEMRLLLKLGPTVSINW